MRPFSLESEQASIVLVGSFNPAIFHPEWLLRNELITKDDIEGADVELVHRDLAKFSLDWLKFDVMRDKLIARTNDPSKYEPLNDLMISILKILEHIPINQLGMNLKLQYNIENEHFWHLIGDNLAPKKYWDFLPDRVGLKSMSMVCSRPDELDGKINIGVGSVKKDSFGLFFDVNSHVALRTGEGEEEIIHDASKILYFHWEKSLSFAKKSCENILKKALDI